jgi:hypothetical protein
VINFYPVPDFAVEEAAQRSAPSSSAKCMSCGRFCRVSPASYEYDGNGTQCYVTFYCSKCGIYTEGMW